MVCFLFGRIRLPDTSESAFTTVVCESWNVGDKYTWIMLEILAATIHGWVLSRIFCLGGKSILKKNRGKRLREKLTLEFLGGSGGMLPRKILKI